MRPLTSDRPKVLLPVAGEPLLVHVLREAHAAGVRTVDLVVHYKREAVEEAIGDGSAFGLSVRYHEQGQPKGTGHALGAVQPRPSEPFVLLSGDTLVAAGEIEALFAALGPVAGAMGAVRVPDARAFGALEVDGERLVRIHEKRPDPPSDLINAGTYAFTPQIFAHVDALQPSPRGELELTDAIEALGRENGVAIVALTSWRDCGRPWDLLAMTEALLQQLADDDPFWAIDGTVESGATLHGKIRIEAGAVVRAGSYIEGPCIIASDARVGPMAYIRGTTVIGRGCHVGAHTETKNTILMEHSNIPHLNYVGDSIIGARVNLGAGTKVANLRHDKKAVRVHLPDGSVDSGRRKMGVVIGHDVKTGINVSLDCGSVVGSGAKLVPGKPYRGFLAGDQIHGMD